MPNPINFRQLTCYTYKKYSHIGRRSLAGQEPRTAVSYRHRGCLSGTQCKLFSPTHHSDIKFCCTTGKKQAATKYSDLGPYSSARAHTGWAGTRFVTRPNVITRSEPNPQLMLLQFKRSMLITICFAPPKIKHFLRWDWETTLARLRPRVSAGVEVTLVALPELCLLVRIRPERMQRQSDC